MEPGWVIVFTTGMEFKARMVQTILEEYGIDSIIMNKQSSSYLVGDVEVYVRLDDSMKARYILEKRGYE